jgi:hypothetical protein
MDGLGLAPGRSQREASHQAGHDENPAAEAVRLIR